LQEDASPPDLNDSSKRLKTTTPPKKRKTVEIPERTAKRFWTLTSGKVVERTIQQCDNTDLGRGLILDLARPPKDGNGELLFTPGELAEITEELDLAVPDYSDLIPVLPDDLDSLAELAIQKCNEALSTKKRGLSAIGEDQEALYKKAKELFWVSSSCLHIFYVHSVMDGRFLGIKHGEKMIDCLFYPIVDGALALTSGYYILRGEHQSETMKITEQEAGLEKCGVKFDSIFKNFDTADLIDSPEYGFTETARTKIDDWHQKLVGDEKNILVGSSFVIDRLLKKSSNVQVHLNKAISLVTTGLSLWLSILTQKEGSDVRVLHRRPPVELRFHYNATNTREVLIEARTLAYVLDKLSEC